VADRIRLPDWLVVGCRRQRGDACLVYQPAVYCRQINLPQKPCHLVTIREQVFPSLPLIYSTEITNVVRGTSYDQINKNEEDINLALSINTLTHWDRFGEVGAPPGGWPQPVSVKWERIHKNSDILFSMAVWLIR